MSNTKQIKQANFDKMQVLVNIITEYKIENNEFQGHIVNKLLDIAKTGIQIKNRDYASNALISLVKYLDLDESWIEFIEVQE